MKSKAVIIDGHNFLFRGFYGVPPQVKRTDGTQINAVYGFFSILRTIIKKIKPEYLIVVFDSETSSNHKKRVRSEYKANRIAQDSSIFFQLSIIKKCLDILGIYWIEDNNNEADDVIGFYSKKFNSKEIEAYICSNDHDFIQLVGDKLFVLRGSAEKTDIFNYSSVLSKLMIIPSQYIDYLSLVGDPSDNIKGIKGIGKKRATFLLSKYKNIEGIYKELNFLPVKIKKLLEFEEKNLMDRRNFLKINCKFEIPIKFNIKKYFFINKSIPDKMGEFLNKNWNKII